MQGIQRQIANHKRRLSELEQKLALLGIGADPAISIEIQDIRAQLARLLVRDLVLNEEQPQSFQGLMVLVGTGRSDQTTLDQSAVDAINYHLRMLRYCWLIGSGGEYGSMVVVEQIRTMFENRGFTMFVCQIDDAASVQNSYDVIARLYREEVPKTGLRDDEVIADITGATKPMSFGMLLACGAGRPMQYMVRRPGSTSMPILLRYTHLVASRLNQTR